MLLSELWFLLIGVLFVGFMFLEGFDFGVGMSTRFLAKNDLDRRMLIQTIGPTWAANEVWLVTAVGAMFAAFPHWYATLLSGYYMPVIVLLLALIARGVSFEFRDRVESEKWVKTWDWSIFIGSIFPPFILGLTFASLIKGLPIDADMNMYAGFFDIVNTYTVVGGLTFVALSYLHGLTFISLKTDGSLRTRARKEAQKWYAITGGLVFWFVILTVFYTEAFSAKGPILIPLYILVGILYGALMLLLRNKKEGFSFTVTGIILIMITASFFIALFPNVMISSLDIAHNITIYEAVSGDYSLRIMTIVAATMIPVVLGYTFWTYYVFRKRVSKKENLNY
ncbi:cytochrome d ubiquinol oxidase subunit II [Sporosarcina pasteurii]|uniref:Cytochrome d ubiquinol oxidase subunit 2 n=1 Tax=Sporosarcina pasteurii TaxID=1474 RepID=A0A380BDT5_SPOPA|nr:cytochrome d ubiquinol oxidase subunit II [Sporosarcina pasteurii]MDS9472837.1 cytochrome d ubiquinol oxidase subunit II [Sporosarcina pasteurii]QBQ06391.1 cytochrome d ubiquinol oxidase subunit II [Sporosarcina pasteurii]SUI98793.1 Cytochrome d ubiquinol oxidase subunit 2 [Sporosarcina pasteurii]